MTVGSGHFVKFSKSIETYIVKDKN